MLGIIRILAGILLAAAVTLFGVELLRLLQNGYYSPMNSAALWQGVHGTSYFRTAEWVNSYLPPLWDPVLTSILAAPSWAILLAGLVLFVLAAGVRRRRR